MNTREDSNKRLVLDAFEALFNRRDFVAAEKYWSKDYLQHSAHINPGREGLFAFVRSRPETLRYEPGLVIAEADFVMLHGRFSGRDRSRIAVDIVRIADERLVEHWDVLQDEATKGESKSGLPMFGKSFPAGR